MIEQVKVLNRRLISDERGWFLKAINGTEEQIYCGLKRKQKKQFKRNKKEYERLSDHIGILPLVFRM